ncbi:MAG: tRNA uridine-5-carboxymethylaminomethyl(34) synthesis enzyme MnmG [Alphaproteobacteria bacterium]|jgi:tRNA uridine 5-carboxymethylaminomethyl modification enzyme|nr:tRNA uridine-5-carboxymethylaminomethyl(34) synthesis enzyme MnmG [Alphaproteobacteria bacterium]
MYDVVVIGGGHAGVEAVAAAAKVGAKALLITLNLDDIGQMSCNPAIGGLGKGHIVREIDALDGLMGRIIDRSGIQFRVLNASKGAAVQGPRSQADRKLYKNVSRETLSEYQKKYNLTILEGSAENIILNNGIIEAVVLSNGEKIPTKSVILTTGTFLNGVIHIGTKNYPGGRYGANPSLGLSEFLKNQNFEVARLKTGTPARLNGKTINWSVLQRQDADIEPKPFSFLNDKIDIPQISCYITETNEITHQIIKDNIKKSAMYSGNISGVGPRYCPSIEDKVVRFADKNKHQIFLEPEGLDDDTVYPNGISTSLPEEVQEKFIRSMKGLESVEILRFGYAIEYDYVNPQELANTLETHKVKNLFLAGQINGTTGYEEAAGQGLVAGINAALKSLEIKENDGSLKKFVLGRDESYIGVMIDDLIHQGVSEPYRMFSSRAEYRMMLRADNADRRLTAKGFIAGCVSIERNDKFLAKMNLINKYKDIMQGLIATPQMLIKAGIHMNQDGIKRNALEILSFNTVNFQDLANIWEELKDIPKDIMEVINTDCKYYHYLKKQEEEIALFKKEENLNIPEDIDYLQVDGLSSELVEKFNKIKPATIGAALRIRGATPSSAIALLAYIKKQKK